MTEAPTGWLIVARANNYGLVKDARLFAAALEACGQTCRIVTPRGRPWWDRLRRRKVADHVVHMERVHDRWLSAGTRNWLVPNQERFPHRHIGRLKHIDGVLAKTRHAEAIFAALGVATSLVGFTSEDRLDRSVAKDWRRCLHLAGGNTLKGTEDVLALWAAHPDWPELVLVQKAEHAPASVPANVTLLKGYADDAALKRLQNECGIHLCPSRSEGWGHHIVEGLSVGSVVITTDAPPMNEHVTAAIGELVAVARQEPRHLGTNFFVDSASLERAVTSVLTAEVDVLAGKGAAARRQFEAMDRHFRDAVSALAARPA